MSRVKIKFVIFTSVSFWPNESAFYKIISFGKENYTKQCNVKITKTSLTAIFVYLYETMKFGKSSQLHSKLHKKKTQKRALNAVSLRITEFEIFTESIALILTVTNYCIWQTRKKQLNSDHQISETVKPSNVLAMIFNHIKTREKKESLQTNKTYYEIIKNIRTKVGQRQHNLIK